MSDRPSSRPATAAPPMRGPHAARGAPTEKPQNFASSARRLLGSLREDAARIVVVIVLGVLSVSLTVLGPWLLGQGTNVVFAGFISPGSGIDFARLSEILVLVVVVYILGSAFALGQARILNVVVQRAMHRLRLQVEAKIHRLPLNYFDRVQRGELLSRVTNDVDNVGQSLQQTLSQIITSLLTVLGVLVMMVVISPLLALIAVLAVPLTVLITVVVARRSQTLFVAQWKQTGILNARVEETYSGHALVKVFGRQSQVEKAFAEENERVYKASFGAQFVSGIIMPSMMFVGNLVYVIVAVVGGVQVAAGQISIGGVQAFIQYSRQFTQPLSQLGSMANLLQSGVASAERVFDLLDQDEQAADADPAITAPDEANHLEFRDVSFRYTEDRPLIDGLSLVAEAGSTVAIVGPTGAGKTTLVNLIMRFYEIDGGSITLGTGRNSCAVDIRSMTRADLRARTGMVLQDTWLFAGTIRENIMYGRPEATEEEMVAAASAAYVDRFVHMLPDGYDTILDDEATNLSIGERQLITIARAFLADPRLLILDEATSSVDTRTELLIQRAMSRLRADRTAFVIAHRLSTIRDADLILVMEDGAIVEQGTHDQLLAAHGAYRRLYDAQFAAPMNVDTLEDEIVGPAG